MVAKSKYSNLMGHEQVLQRQYHVVRGERTSGFYRQALPRKFVQDGQQHDDGQEGECGEFGDDTLEYLYRLHWTRMGLTMLVVPEPATLLLLTPGGLMLPRRRR